MVGATPAARIKAPRPRLSGAQTFSRIMTWLCSGLSAMIFVSLAGIMAIVVLATNTTVIPCDSAKAQVAWSGAAKIDCHRDPAVVTTVEHLRDGRTVTRTTSATPQTPPEGFLGVALLLTPAAVLAVALWQAGRFFAQLSKGRAFQARTVARLRNFSALGVLLLVLNPLMPTLARLVETALGLGVTSLNWNPDLFGWRPTLAELLNIVFAATLVAMVSVLARAAAIAEDNAQII